MRDVLIAGGGLAGSAVAIQLGRLGVSVELFECGRFPKEKPCGEGLMPSGVATLERLGLDGSKGAPFNGICYHFGERIAEGRFPKGDGLPCLGRGFRRLHLDHALFESARRTPNVKVHTGALVEAPLVKDGRVVGLIVDGTPRYGDLVIGADGARSRLRHALKLDLPSHRKRVGVCAHFRLAAGKPMPQSVNVYIGPGYELYATPLPQGELALAGLASAGALDGRLENQFQRWWIRQPHLALTLEGAEQVGEMLAVSPVSGRARRRFLPGFILLGDAAGFTDPITGGGMTQALLAAELLCQYVGRNAQATADWLLEFDRQRESLLRDYRRLTALLLWLARNPAFLSVSLETMCRLPRVFSHLLGVAAGTRRLRGAVPARDRVPAPTVQRKIWPVLPERRGDRAA
ncbi:MAG: NAD(P)/FAD-dependent oxidoreductase [Candidatus Acidiferrales bacterium]